MFSFYKYATFILPSMERAAYIRDPQTEGDGWLTAGCSLCRGYFDCLYRDKGVGDRPICPSVTARCLSGDLQPWRKQHPTLLSATSRISAHSRWFLGFPLKTSSMWLQAVDCRWTFSFPKLFLVISLLTTAWPMRRRRSWGSIRNIYMLIRLLPSTVPGCMWLWTTELLW